MTYLFWLQRTLDDVSYVLSRWPADCQPTRVEPLGTAGGLSGARFWRLAAPRGRLLLRRWPPEHPSAEALQWIHAVIRHAARRGLAFLPVPAMTGDGRSFVRHAGHMWELAPWLPGTADYEPQRRPAKLRAALAALAQFHAATADFRERGDGRRRMAETVRGASPAIVHRLTRLREMQSTGVGELSSVITDSAWPELAPPARRFVELLPRAVPSAASALAPLANLPLALQPCLRDVWHDHVLLTGDRVTGLIDFGAMGVETPAGDVARLLGSLAGDDPAAWRTGLEAYAAVRAASPDELRAAAALDASGTVLAGCNWIEWIYVDGRQFEDRDQVAVRFDRLLQRLRRLVERAGPVPLEAIGVRR